MHCSGYIPLFLPLFSDAAGSAIAISIFSEYLSPPFSCYFCQSFTSLSFLLALAHCSSRATALRSRSIKPGRHATLHRRLDRYLFSIDSLLDQSQRSKKRNNLPSRTTYSMIWMANFKPESRCLPLLLLCFLIVCLTSQTSALVLGTRTDAQPAAPSIQDSHPHAAVRREFLPAALSPHKIRSPGGSISGQNSEDLRLDARE